MLVNVQGDDSADIRLNIFMTGLTQVVTFLLSALLFAMLYKGNVTGYLKIDGSKNKWGQGLLAILITMFLLPFVDQLTIWNEGMDFGSGEERNRGRIY